MIWPNKDFWGHSNKCAPLIYTNRCTHCSISRSTLAISEKSLESIIFPKKVCVGLLRIVTTAFKLFLYIDWYNLDTNTFSYNVHFLINYDRYLSGTHCDPKELLSILQIFTFWKGPYAYIFFLFIVWKHSSEKKQYDDEECFVLLQKKLLHCENPNFLTVTSAQS